MDPNDLAERWTDLWNGNLAVAQTLLADDFQIHFGGVDEASRAGDNIQNAEQMATYVDQFRAARPGLEFSVESAPVSDSAGIAFRWHTTRDGVERSGIDLIRVESDRIAEVWSVTGGRRFSGRTG